MQTVGYCRECRCYVAVTEEGCESGHPPIALGDVRNIPDGAPLPGTAVAAAPKSADLVGGRQMRPNELVMDFAAKGVILVPVALVAFIEQYAPARVSARV